MVTGWIGNIFIVLGMWVIGNKNRKGFLVCSFGELIWTIYSAKIGMYDLASICTVFIIMNCYNFFKWGRNGSV